MRVLVLVAVHSQRSFAENRTRSKLALHKAALRHAPGLAVLYAHFACDCISSCGIAHRRLPLTAGVEIRGSNRRSRISGPEMIRFFFISGAGSRFSLLRRIIGTPSHTSSQEAQNNRCIGTALPIFIKTVAISGQPSRLSSKLPLYRDSSSRSFNMSASCSRLFSVISYFGSALTIIGFFGKSSGCSTMSRDQ